MTSLQRNGGRLIKRSSKRLKPSHSLKTARRRRIKPSSIAKLKKTLEALQKQIIIKTYGTDCYTCSQTNLIGANCQLGHIPWPRSLLSTDAKFDTRFGRIQCFRCNIHLGGNGAIALKRMQDEGIDTDALWKFSQTTKGKSVPKRFFIGKITEYQIKLAALKEMEV